LICSIPLTSRLEDYRAQSCGDGSHWHLSWAELRPHLEQNRVVFLVEAKTRKEKTVVWILPEDAPPLTKAPSMTGIVNSGLSFRVGDYLAKRIRQKESWAEAMFQQIRGRRE
jgi:hypothetical protein